MDTLGQSLNQSITQIITSVATMVGVLVMMLRISPLMTLIAVVILPISVTLISLVVKKSQKYFKQQQEYLGHINGQVEETYAGHTVIQAYNKEKDMVQQFQETNDTLYHSAWKSQFLSGLMQPIMMFVGNLGYAAVALSGGLLAIRGTITIGDIQAFIQYVKNFTQPMQQIAQVLNQVQSMAAASERVFEFLEEAEEVQTAEHPLELANVEGNVDFQHVSFGYQPEQCVIHDFSAKVKSGQKIAIVGPTGAGKTTFLNVLSNFIPKEERVITIEDSAELQIQNIANLVRLEARNRNVEGKNEVTIRDLVKSALRMRPDRIIVGEIRDSAAIDLLTAMNTGHDGSLSTGHANSPKDMLNRLETLFLMGLEIPLAAIRQQIASGIDIMIHLGRLRDKSRRVLEISEVGSVVDGKIELHPLFIFEEQGEMNGRVKGHLVRTKTVFSATGKAERAGVIL